MTQWFRAAFPYVVGWILGIILARWVLANLTEEVRAWTLCFGIGMLAILIPLHIYLYVRGPRESR